MYKQANSTCNGHPTYPDPPVTEIVSNPYFRQPEMQEWPLYCDHEQLRVTLHNAAKRSAHLGRAVLASFTQAIEWCDGIRIFTGATLAGLGESFFWERLSEQRALVGIGSASTIETHGPTRFTTASAAWRALLCDAVFGGISRESSGPLLFGGFAFDPLSPHTPLWEGFPDGLLVLPHLLLSYSDGRATLTVNKIVQPSAEIEQDAEEIATTVMCLRAAVEEVSLQPRRETTRISCIQDLPSASQWMEQVANTVKMIQQGVYEKVVLARSVRVTTTTPTETFDVSTILDRLRQSSPGASIFAIQRGERYFVGATPERLMRAQDGQIQTMALAGSAPRGATEEEDRRIGRELLQSEKNNDEHAIVVTMMREALANLCSRIWTADAPQLLRLKNIQHLETPIVGELMPGRCLLEAIDNLHPTPAVGGFPRHAALEAIRAAERMDRGWYAGPIGWIDANRNGEFAVALRSALVYGNEATLFAGCGIVADSDPQSEYAESCLKLQVMLRALGSED